MHDQQSQLIEIEDIDDIHGNQISPMKIPHAQMTIIMINQNDPYIAPRSQWSEIQC